MPFSSLEKQREYRKHWKSKRVEANRAELAALGHHSRQSIAWPKPPLTECQAVWVAAVIDCEGTLRVGSYMNKKRGGYNFHVNAQVHMTDTAVVERLRDLCGGNINFQKTRDPKRKDMWLWSVSANGCRWLLPQIRPHLLIKHRQAALLLEFLTLSKRGASGRAHYNQRCQEIRAEMATLNTRGKPTGVGALVEPLIK